MQILELQRVSEPTCLLAQEREREIVLGNNVSVCEKEKVCLFTTK